MHVLHTADNCSVVCGRPRQLGPLCALLKANVTSNATIMSSLRRLSVRFFYLKLVVSSRRTNDVKDDIEWCNLCLRRKCVTPGSSDLQIRVALTLDLHQRSDSVS